MNPITQPRPSRLLTSLPALLIASLAFPLSAFADTYANNGGTNLSLPSSWIDLTNSANTGILAPGPNDIAQWDFHANLSAPKTFTLPVTKWQGISVINPGAEVILSGNYASSCPITINSGTLTFAPTTNPRGTPGVLLNIPALSINSTGIFNTTNHDLIVGNTTPNVINNEILNGVAVGPGGAQIAGWTENLFAIPSTLPHPTTFTVPLEAASIEFTSWDNVPITDPTAIIVKYTYFGDATIDGVGNGDDFSVIAGNFGATTLGISDIQASWLSGDLDLDGHVGGNDFSVLAGNFNYSPLVDPATNTASPSTVPEPATLTLLSLSVALLITKKRRRAQTS